MIRGLCAAAFVLAAPQALAGPCDRQTGTAEARCLGALLAELRAEREAELTAVLRAALEAVEVAGDPAASRANRQAIAAMMEAWSLYAARACAAARRIGTVEDACMIAETEGLIARLIATYLTPSDPGEADVPRPETPL